MRPWEPDEPAHLPEPDTAGLLDPPEGLLSDCRLALESGARRAGLHNHHAHRVGHHIVQLASDPSALRGHRILRRALSIVCDPSPPVEGHPTEQHRDPDRDDDTGEHVDPVVDVGRS